MQNSNSKGVSVCVLRVIEPNQLVLADAMSILKDFVSSSLNFTANISNIIKATATSAFAAQLLGVNGIRVSIMRLDLVLVA
nr:auxin-binding protein ABP19a-like [Tanacetum cinerariifolium]